MDQVTRRILNRAQKQIKRLKEITERDVSKKFNIPILLDELDAATFKGNSLSTSASLAGKVNLILEALRKMGVVK